jgi:hypothetical protein
MTGCHISFNRADTEIKFDHAPFISTEPEKITAKYYYDFGNNVATDADHVLVSSFDDIHVFKCSSSGIELIQTIKVEESNGITCMIVHESELIFGLADYCGTGTVYVYTRKGDEWELSQEIRKERKGDYFGCAIDVEGETMVVGASAIFAYSPTTAEGEGRVYVFRKTDGVWEETQTLLADQAGPGDDFGTCVGICGDQLLAGSPMLPLHVYRFNGEWELSGTEDIYTRKIAHSENNFLVSGDYEFEAFTLEADGTLTKNTIKSFYRKDNIAWSGEIIEMRDSLAIVAMQSEECYLFKYGDREWNVETIFSPDYRDNCRFSGMAITDRYAIIGGTKHAQTQFGYVYFRDLESGFTADGSPH